MRLQSMIMDIVLSGSASRANEGRNLDLIAIIIFMLDFGVAIYN